MNDVSVCVLIGSIDIQAYNYRFHSKIKNNFVIIPFPDWTETKTKWNRFTDSSCHQYWSVRLTVASLKKWKYMTIVYGFFHFVKDCTWSYCNRFDLRFLCRSNVLTLLFRTVTYLNRRYFFHFFHYKRLAMTQNMQE